MCTPADHGVYPIHAIDYDAEKLAHWIIWCDGVEDLREVCGCLVVYGTAPWAEWEAWRWSMRGCSPRIELDIHLE